MTLGLPKPLRNLRSLMDYPYLDLDPIAETIKIVVAEGTELDLQDVTVIANGEPVQPTQDWEDDPSDLLVSADTLELEANGKIYPIPSGEDLDSEVFDILLEKISPT